MYQCLAIKKGVRNKVADKFPRGNIYDALTHQSFKGMNLEQLAWRKHKI